MLADARACGHCSGGLQAKTVLVSVCEMPGFVVRAAAPKPENYTLQAAFAAAREPFCIYVVPSRAMPFADTLPSRGAGLASCSYDRRRPSVGRRPGRGAAVLRARRSQQGGQPWSPSSEAIGMALGVLQHQLSSAAPALAEDMAAYDASGVSDSLKNAFGVAYVAVLIGFGIRLFSKRAQRFTTEVSLPPRPSSPTQPPILQHGRQPTSQAHTEC